MTDEELVRQVTNGRTAAYGELVHRWSARVLAMCHARVNRSAIAEELAQETLLRGLTALPTIRNPEQFGSWICGIAHRVCLDWLKSKQSAQVSLNSVQSAAPVDVAQSAETQTAGDVLLQTEEDQQLAQAIADLPDENREVLHLFYYDDLTYQQMADLLDVSVATVNSRLAKARALLRMKLAE